MVKLEQNKIISTPVSEGLNFVPEKQTNMEFDTNFLFGSAGDVIELDAWVPHNSIEQIVNGFEKNTDAVFGNLKFYNENDKTIKLILTGSISLILMQAMIHIGVNIRLFPTTGMTLPFLSYGGSSIISTSILAGIILNLTKRKIT